MILPLALVLGAAVGPGNPVALAVSPARAVVVAPASRAVEVRNAGTQQLAVDVSAGYIDRRRLPHPTVRIRPARLVLPGGTRAVMTLRVQPRRAPPGDHELMVLVQGRPRNRARVGVRLRLAVRVRIRVTGTVVRRLDVRGVRVVRTGRERVLVVAVTNRGNVTEQLRGRLTLTLVRAGGRVVSRLRSRVPREVLPRSGALIRMRYTGRARGILTAVVRLRRGPPVPPVQRRFRVRL